MKRALLVVVVACGGSLKPAQPVALTAAPPIDLRASALVEQGDAVYMFGSKVAAIVRGGVVVSRIESPNDWVIGASIAAPDGDGRWVVAIDRKGAPYRVTLSGELEPVAERLGLVGGQVTDLGASGTTFAAVVGNSIAYTTDGVHLTRVPVADPKRIYVARGTLAHVTKTTIERWDLVHGTRVVYPITATTAAFLDADSDHPRLVATDYDRVWIEADGKLVPHAMGCPVMDLATRGPRAWVECTGGKLFMFDGARFAPAQPTEARGALVAASSTGEPWLATDRGLVRYSLGASAEDAAWRAEVAPVFQKVCAHCHLPGGEAGIDLSTAASWGSEHAEIVRRVLVTRTMPPAGTDLADSDRAALEHWLGAK